MVGRNVSEYDDSGYRIRVTTETFQSGAISRWITTYKNDRTVSLSHARYALVPMRVLSTNCSVASSMARPRLPSEWWM